MTKRSVLVTAVALMPWSTLALADTVVLKDGRVLQGTFKGGTESIIKFEAGGKLQDLAVGDITSLTFSPREATAAAQQPAATAAAAAAPASGSVTVPAGTKLTIKTTETVSTASHQTGSKFKAALETDLVVNGVVAAPKGTEVYGKVLESSGGRRVGVQRLMVTFSDLSINNQMVPIVTEDAGAEGGRGGAARKVGAGALIGAAAGDAGAGAAVGAGVALLSRGNHIEVPAGTLVEVALKEAVTITK
ncbi:MAG: hypothetical protein ACREOO_26250 [bacterium]